MMMIPCLVQIRRCLVVMQNPLWVPLRCSAQLILVLLMRLLRLRIVIWFGLIPMLLIMLVKYRVRVLKLLQHQLLFRIWIVLGRPVGQRPHKKAARLVICRGMILRPSIFLLLIRILMLQLRKVLRFLRGFGNLQRRTIFLVVTATPVIKVM